MSYLALVRHGQSTYNEKGWWTGWANPPLTDQGIIEAQQAGEALKDIHFDLAYTSVLDRAKQTLEEIKKIIGQPTLITTHAEELNERNYGDYTGKNKWEIQKEVGDETFLRIRRAWDEPIPNGESLKQVYEREIPYFTSEVIAKIKSGKNVLIATSGNAIRAMVKYLENVPDEEVAHVEIATGQIYLYTMNEQGEVVQKEIRVEKKNTS